MLFLHIASDNTVDTHVIIAAILPRIVLAHDSFQGQARLLAHPAGSSISGANRTVHTVCLRIRQHKTDDGLHGFGHIATAAVFRPNIIPKLQIAVVWIDVPGFDPPDHRPIQRNDPVEGKGFTQFIHHGGDSLFPLSQ